MEKIQDQFGRSFRTLRISLINTCNFACTYCVCSDAPIKQEKPEDLIFSVDQLLQVIKELHQRLGLRTIRLTGGEPLLYKQLSPLIQGIIRLGIKDIKLTTNGLLLGRMAAELRSSGLLSVNVSLDAMDPAVFLKITRRDRLSQVLDGIKAAKAAGLNVKLNAVIMRGQNECQVLPLLRFVFQQKIKVRFLELMPMGHLFGTEKSDLFSQQELLTLISEHYAITKQPRENAATATYWKTSEGEFGIIANESEPFCGDCDRLRLDMKGNIYGCLSSNQPISIRNLTQGVHFDRQLEKALKQKQTLKFTGSNLSMLHIGG